MTLEEKLELFEDCAIAEASHQSSVMLAEYRQTLEKIYETKIAQAQKDAENYIITETDRIQREHNRALSMEQNKIKRDIGEKHYKVKEQIIADVKSQLLQYRKTPGYMDDLIAHIEHIKAAVLGNTVEIFVAPGDAGFIPALKKACGMDIHVSDTDFDGGIRAVVPTKNILIDYSYASLLLEEKNSFKI